MIIWVTGYIDLLRCVVTMGILGFFLGSLLYAFFVLLVYAIDYFSSGRKEK